MSLGHEHSQGRGANISAGQTVSVGQVISDRTAGRTPDGQGQAGGIEAIRAAAQARADQERTKAEPQRDPAKVAAAPAAGEPKPDQAQVAGVQARRDQVTAYGDNLGMRAEAEAARKGVSLETDGLSVRGRAGALAAAEKMVPVDTSAEFMKGWTVAGLDVSTMPRLEASAAGRNPTADLSSPTFAVGQQRSQEPAMAQV